MAFVKSLVYCVLDSYLIFWLIFREVKMACIFLLACHLAILLVLVALNDWLQLSGGTLDRISVSDLLRLLLRAFLLDDFGTLKLLKLFGLHVQIVLADH